MRHRLRGCREDDLHHELFLVEHQVDGGERHGNSYAFRYADEKGKIRTGKATRSDIKGRLGDHLIPTSNPRSLGQLVGDADVFQRGLLGHQVAETYAVVEGAHFNCQLAAGGVLKVGAHAVVVIAHALVLPTGIV